MGSKLTPCTHPLRNAFRDSDRISENGQGEKNLSIKKGKWIWPKEKFCLHSTCAVGLPGDGGSLDCLWKYGRLPVLRSQNISLLISPNFLLFIEGLLSEGTGWHAGLRRPTHWHWLVALKLRKPHWLWRAGEKRKRQEKEKGGRSTIPVQCTQSSCSKLGLLVKSACVKFYTVTVFK